MVLQALEGLSDRDAIRALRTRIDWKVACGLALDDPGFDFTVLTYWRTRLRQSDRPERIFDAVRTVIEATGVLKGKHRRALDSSILDDAVATQDTVTQLIAAIRKVRGAVPEAALVPLSTASDVGGKPIIEWSDTVARNELITGLVHDAEVVLAAAQASVSSRDRRRGDRPAGPDRRPGRRARRRRWDLEDRPQGRKGPGHLDRRRRGPPRPQVDGGAHRRLQSASWPPSPTPGSSPR